MWQCREIDKSFQPLIRSKKASQVRKPEKWSPLWSIPLSFYLLVSLVKIEMRHETEREY